MVQEFLLYNNCIMANWMRGSITFRASDIHMGKHLRLELLTNVSLKYIIVEWSTVSIGNIGLALVKQMENVYTTIFLQFLKYANNAHILESLAVISLWNILLLNLYICLDINYKPHIKTYLTYKHTLSNVSYKSTIKMVSTTNIGNNGLVWKKIKETMGLS